MRYLVTSVGVQTFKGNQEAPKYFMLREDGKRFYSIDWDNTKPMAENCVYTITGPESEFNGENTIKVYDLQQVDCDKSIFANKSKFSLENLLGRMDGLIDQVVDPTLKELALNYKKDPEFGRFCDCPGARSIHHAYIHGLLEHSVSVTETACSLLKTLDNYYDKANKDIITVGALFHDWGKIFEYTYDEYALKIESSKLGKKISHVTMGANKMLQMGHKAGCSDDDLTDLNHLVLSHHGQLEFGSPVVPRTIEAFVVHQADMMDFHFQHLSNLLNNCGGEETSKSVHGIKFLKKAEEGEV